MRTHRILASVGAVALVAAGLVAGGATVAVATSPANPAPSCVASNTAPDQLSCTVTYHSTGAEQVFTAPAGVTSVDVELVGASGGGAVFGIGGRGDQVTGSYTVPSATPLYVYVGGKGSLTTGGFNGGGSPGNSDNSNRESGGGGATDIRTLPAADAGSLASRVAVAGGGGGAVVMLAGGDAGQAGESSSSNTGSSGRGGTQNSGGAGGSLSSNNAGAPGVLGGGGGGGDHNGTGALAGGGGGGGGLYGGGGGVSNGYGSGGGGSSLVPSGWQQALANDDPVARFTYSVPVSVITLSAPSTPALQTATFTAMASASEPGHSASATTMISSLSAVIALSPGGQTSDVRCIALSCTSTRAGQYNIRAEFGTWSGPATFTLEFSSLTQTIDFAGSTINLQQPMQLAATSTSGLPVSYTVNSGPCTLAGSALTATDVGTCSVTASQAGQNPYDAAPGVAQDFAVAPVTLVASSNPAALTATAGVAYEFPVELQDEQGAPVSPQPVIDYSFAPGCSFGSNGVATEAGSCEVTATVRGSTTLTTTFTVKVLAAPQPPAQPDRATPGLPNTGQGDGVGAMTAAAALALLVLGAGLILVRRRTGSIGR